MYYTWTAERYGNDCQVRWRAIAPETASHGQVELHSTLVTFSLSDIVIWMESGTFYRCPREDTLEDWLGSWLGQRISVETLEDDRCRIWIGCQDSRDHHCLQYTFTQEALKEMAQIFCQHCCDYQTRVRQSEPTVEDEERVDVD